MARRSTNPALSGIKTAIGGQTFDPDGFGENLATLGRARDEEDQFYRNQREADMAPGGGGVLADAVHMGQQGGAMMQDPGMKVFLQALHERGAKVGGSLDLPNSPTGMPVTFDPTFQSSAVVPSEAMKALQQVVRAKRQKGF